MGLVVCSGGVCLSFFALFSPFQSLPLSLPHPSPICPSTLPAPISSFLPTFSTLLPPFASFLSLSFFFLPYLHFRFSNFLPVFAFFSPSKVPSPILQLFCLSMLPIPILHPLVPILIYSAPLSFLSPSFHRAPSS